MDLYYFQEYIKKLNIKLKKVGRLLDIEEVTSRSQYARAKKLLQEILIKRGIIEKQAEYFKKA